MKKIIISLAIILAVGAIVTAATTAYFTDTETSTGNTFTAGTLDLKVSASDNNQVMFSLANVVPGQSGGAEVILNNAGSIDGFIDFIITQPVDDDLENGCPEPEDIDDSTCDTPGAGQGELDSNLSITAFLEKGGVDNVYDTGDVLVYQGFANGPFASALQDYAFAHNTSETFRINWSVASSVGNIIQGDTAKLDITFELNQTSTTQ